MAKVHYSHRVVCNSQLHFGVFLEDRLEGVMQFGPPIDKRKLIGLVRETKWNGFIELNRMAFTERLPRNSESRALSVALRLLKKHATHLSWIVTFADASQCGDGTIYRASGFVLTGIKPNNQIWQLPSGERFSRVTATKYFTEPSPKRLRAAIGLNADVATMKDFKKAGATPIPGFQLRYLYFLDPTVKSKLTVPILPFTEIQRRGASMYRGQPRAGSSESGTSAVQAGGGGATPTPALLSSHDPK